MRRTGIPCQAVASHDPRDGTILLAARGERNFRIRVSERSLVAQAHPLATRLVHGGRMQE